MRLAVVNQKGGVGKTTTAVNLAYAVASLGHRVLVVDLDPQANATTGLGVDHRQVTSSVYEVVIEGAEPRSVIAASGYPNLDILPSSIDLAGAELELVSALARERKLHAALENISDDYAVVFIDCPPSLGLLTVNALTAAERVLVPIQCEYYALEGLSQLMRNIELVRSGLNAGLEIGGIVLTMYDARTKLSEQVAQEVRKYFGEKVFSTVIPRSVRLSEAPSYGQPALVYDPSSRGSMAYRWLAEEFAGRFLGGPATDAAPDPPETERGNPATHAAPSDSSGTSWIPGPGRALSIARTILGSKRADEDATDGPATGSATTESGIQFGEPAATQVPPVTEEAERPWAAEAGEEAR